MRAHAASPCKSLRETPEGRPVKYGLARCTPADGISACRRRGKLGTPRMERLEFMRRHKLGKAKNCSSTGDPVGTATAHDRRLAGSGSASCPRTTASPRTQTFGHDEVSSGHKEADEGATITNAIRGGTMQQASCQRAFPMMRASRLMGNFTFSAMGAFIALMVAAGARPTEWHAAEVEAARLQRIANSASSTPG